MPHRQTWSANYSSVSITCTLVLCKINAIWYGLCFCSCSCSCSCSCCCCCCCAATGCCSSCFSITAQSFLSETPYKGCQTLRTSAWLRRFSQGWASPCLKKKRGWAAELIVRLPSNFEDLGNVEWSGAFRSREQVMQYGYPMIVSTARMVQRKNIHSRAPVGQPIICSVYLLDVRMIPSLLPQGRYCVNWRHGHIAH